MAPKAISRILESGLMAFLLLVPSTQAADKRPVVAVFDVQTKFLKMPKAKLDMLTELLGQELGVGGVYQVMPPGDVKSNAEMLNENRWPEDPWFLGDRYDLGKPDDRCGSKK